jgi:GR25 family glycosyltransferase involved in LPS biosynthesis
LDANSHLKIYTPYGCGGGGCGGGCVSIYDIKRYECTNLTLGAGVYDKIYIINLEHRTDRKDSVIKQLEKEGITNYEFVNAVNGNDSTILKLFKKIRKNGSKIGTTGHLGCLLSHRKVLLKAKEDNVNQFMILEDDVILKDGFMDMLNDVVLPEWECIYLSAPLEEKKLFFNGWARHSKYCTTHAMIIKASIIDYLLDLIKDCDDYIDRIYSHTLQKHKKTYLLDDIVLTSDANDTNTSKKNKKFLYMVKNYNQRCL